MVPTKAADGRTMIGHVVLCHCGDGVALWQISTDGFNTGAILVPSRDAFTDVGTARRLLAACAGRAVISWDPAEQIAILRCLEEIAGTGYRSWCAVALPDVLAEIASVRNKIARRVAEGQAGLEWPIEMPEPLPVSEIDMYRMTRLRIGEWAHPVAAEVLLVCRLVTWAIQYWQDTMTALGRHESLRCEFGSPTVLPPGWERILADAYAA